MSDVQRQELHCHQCGKYIQFDLDLSLEGKHILSCPICNHEHCRVVQGGKITESRWDNRNGGGDKPPIENPDGCQKLRGSKKEKKEDGSLYVSGQQQQVFQVPASSITYTVTSTFTLYQGTGNTGCVYLYMSWMDASSTSST